MNVACSRSLKIQALYSLNGGGGGSGSGGGTGLPASVLVDSL